MLFLKDLYLIGNHWLPLELGLLENRKHVSFLFVTSAYRTVSGTQVIISFLSLLNGWLVSYIIGCFEHCGLCYSYYSLTAKFCSFLPGKIKGKNTKVSNPLAVPSDPLNKEQKALWELNNQIFNAESKLIHIGIENIIDNWNIITTWI